MSHLLVGTAKRPEVTIGTMGTVTNPNGENVNAVSAAAKAKKQKVFLRNNVDEDVSSHPTSSTASSTTQPQDPDGNSKRNITRKKSEFVFSTQGKRQGGAGKSKWAGQDDGSDQTGLERHRNGRVKLDKNDPLYDSEDDDDRYVLVSGSQESGGEELMSTHLNNSHSPPRHSYDPNFQRVIIGPKLLLAEFKLRLIDSIREYFLSGDTSEVIHSITEMQCADYHYEVVKRAISMSLDKKDHERELVSKLLSECYPSVLSMDNIGKGFERLFENLDDLSIDAPNASGAVTSFLARAVVDEILPPSFLSDPLVKQLGGPVIEKAVQLLSREHCAIRLANCWGPGDGRPVAELKLVMDQLLSEYLLSRELDEATVCVNEMNAPHFHHELIKRGVKCALDADTETDVKNMSMLFKFLSDNDVISSVQMRKGFDRVHQVLPDFLLDCPNAGLLVKGMVDQGISDNLLPTDYVGKVG